MNSALYTRKIRLARSLPKNTFLDSEWIFHISANRFLRNMVRAIVGTLLDVGCGKLSLADFQTILESQDRTKAGSSAPAHGLFLMKVQYPNTIFETNG